MKRKRWLIAALIIVALVPPTAAFAKYTESEQASATFGTGKLYPPTSLTAALGLCVPKVGPSSGYREVVLVWTPTVSTIAGGYEVFRSTTSGASYTMIAALPGLATSAYVDGSVGESTTYYYVVRATRNLWRSAYSNEVSLTTPKANCK